MHDSWDEFVQTHSNPHFLQLQAWGRLKEQFGWTSQVVAIGQSGERVRADEAGAAGIASGAQILCRPLVARSPFHKVPGLKLAYIPKGPLVDWHDEAAVATTLTHIDAACRRAGAGILKIEPELPDTQENRELLARYGFTPSIQSVQPQSTMLLDISHGEDEILARMKNKWRYNIRLAKRKEVTVRLMTAADLPAFHALMQTTGERNGFYVHEPAYYEAAFELFAPDHAAFLLAEYNERPLAAVVIMAVGKTAWYPWGASSNEERNRMPNYALHWAGIKWAKSRGATLYDFWGIPDDIGKVGMGMDQATEHGIPAAEVPVDLKNLPSGELWGVYRLKQGFGGNVFRTVGPWDRAIRAPVYALYQLGLKLRK